MKVADLFSMIRHRLTRDTTYRTQEYWDAKAQSYEDRAASMWPNNHLNELYEAEQFAFVDACLGDITGLDILDLGCGTGRFSRHLAARGAQVHGIDFSPETIAIAKKLTQGDNPRYSQGSIFELDAVEEYDIITTCAVLTMALREKDEILDVLGRMAKALRPSGKILLLEPLHEGFFHRVLSMKPDVFIELVEQSGFQIEKVQPLHFLPTRVLLSYYPFPKFFTKIHYEIGQRLMQLSPYKISDYTGIFATKK